MSYHGEGWRQRTRDLERWSAGADAFVYATIENMDLGGKALAGQRAKATEAQDNATQERRAKRARTWKEPATPWRTQDEVPAHCRALLDLKGDSQVVVSWLNGTAKVISNHYRAKVLDAMDRLAERVFSGEALPAQQGGDWFRHVYREANTKADEVATATLEAGSFLARNAGRDIPTPIAGPLRWRGSFDGGRRGRRASAAAVVEIATCQGWKVWKTVGRPFTDITSTGAEVQVASLLSELIEGLRNQSSLKICVISFYASDGPV